MFGRGRKGGVAGWTAVDAGPDGIAAASVRSAADGKPRVLKCGHIPETELDTDTLLQVAKRVATGFPWTMPLSRGEYKIFVVPQPSVEPAEMAQSVRWSLGPMLDFSVEEAALDWMSIPTAKEMPQRPPHIYVIAAHKDVVAHRGEVFKKAKVNLRAVDVRETAQRNIAVRIQKPGEGLGMVALNGRGVQITFTYDGELFLDRYIEQPIEPLMTDDAESRERVFDRITLQVQRSIDFMNRTYPFISISRIVIAPMPAPVPLGDYLSQNVTEPVEMLDLSSVFDFTETPELADNENQSRYFTALGAALRGMEAPK